MATKDEVIEAYFFVYYEIRCLNDLLFQAVRNLRYLDPEDHYDITHLVQDSMVKACLLHLRNLGEFFEFPSGKATHISIEDYGLHAKKLLDNKTNRKLNNDLAHLTYDRLSRELNVETNWNIKDTFGPVFEECKSFLKHVHDQAKRHGLLKSYDRRVNQNTEELIKKIDLTLTLFKKIGTTSQKTSYIGAH